jgi:hypothetical protein
MSRTYAATVKGGFWPNNGVGVLADAGGWGALRRHIAMLLDGKGTLELRQRASTLNGVVPGTVATKNRTVVAAVEDLSGKRAITTETLINRVTTAADKTEIGLDFYNLTTRTSFGASPVANKDANPLGTR